MTYKARILLIDDDAQQHLLVSRALGAAGFEIESAHNGAEGLALAQAAPPDLILCDISMPQTDGYDVLRAAQADARLSQVPFIFVTAHGSYDAVRTGMGLGADDYLVKPFTLDQLRKAVTSRLERTRQLLQPLADEMDALRSSIATLLPHELRTPLMLLDGYTSLLGDDLHTIAPPLRQMIEPIIEATDRLNHLVENCIAYTEACAAPTADTLTPLEAAPIIEEQALAAALAQQREDDLMLDLDASEVYFPEEDLGKIVSEVVDNACKFSPAGTPIEIVSNVRDSFYALSISDQGRGMTPEQIANIGAYMQFERQRYEQQGIGMGLVLAQQLARRNGSVFEIESEVGAFTRVSLMMELAATR